MKVIDRASGPAGARAVAAGLHPARRLAAVARFHVSTAGMQNFELLWERPIYLRVMGNTFRDQRHRDADHVAAGLSGRARHGEWSRRLRRWLMFLVLVPFWTSLLVRSFATVILLQRHGPLNSFLLGLGVVGEPLPLLYNMTGSWRAPCRSCCRS
jgi:ABC-type spermidine/putrescine transport system permease subunit I